MEIDTIIYSGNTPLKATLRIPESGASLFPVVILCHGHSRHKNDGLQFLAADLENGGIASLRFDFSGCGEDAVRRYHLYCASRWPRDLIGAIDFVQSVPSLDAMRIGVAGISMGGSTVFVCSGMDRRIKSTVSMAPVADCGRWLEGVWQRSRGDWVSFCQRIERDSIIASKTGCSQLIPTLNMYNDTPEAILEHNRECLQEPGNNAYVSLDSLAELLTYRPFLWAKEVKNPLLLIHGEEDTLVPEENSLLLKEEAASKTCVRKTYPGISHNIPADKQREMVFRDIVSWFQETLV